MNVIPQRIHKYSHTVTHSQVTIVNVSWPSSGIFYIEPHLIFVMTEEEEEEETKTSDLFYCGRYAVTLYSLSNQNSLENERSSHAMISRFVTTPGLHGVVSYPDNWYIYFQIF